MACPGTGRTGSMWSRIASETGAMSTLLVDANVEDEQRRGQLYDGHLFLYSPTARSLAFVELAREIIGEAFGRLDPETAQFILPVEEYAALLADLKPKFIHHPQSKECIQGL